MTLLNTNSSFPNSPGRLIKYISLLSENVEFNNFIFTDAFTPNKHQRMPFWLSKQCFPAAPPETGWRGGGEGGMGGGSSNSAYLSGAGAPGAPVINLLFSRQTSEKKVFTSRMIDSVSRVPMRDRLSLMLSIPSPFNLLRPVSEFNLHVNQDYRN